MAESRPVIPARILFEMQPETLAETLPKLANIVGCSVIDVPRFLEGLRKTVDLTEADLEALLAKAAMAKMPAPGTEGGRA